MCPSLAAPPARGWTLSELLVTVLVCAVLLTLTGPSFSRFLLQRELEGLSAQLQHDLQVLRTAAVSRQEPLRWSLLTGTGGTCSLVHSGEAADCSCASPARCGGTARLMRSLVVRATDPPVSLSSNVGSMRIDPRHGTVSPTGSIELASRDGHTIRHVVNILGRVRTCSPSGMSGLPRC